MVPGNSLAMSVSIGMELLINVKIVLAQIIFLSAIERLVNASCPP
jgi:hypothetical protein